MSNIFKKFKNEISHQNFSTKDNYKNEYRLNSVENQKIQIYKFTENVENKATDLSMITDDEASNSNYSLNRNHSNKFNCSSLVVPSVSNVEEIFQFLSQKIAKYCQVLADLTNCEVFYKAQLPHNMNIITSEHNFSNDRKSQETIIKNSSVYWGTHQMLFEYSHGKGIRFSKKNGDCLIRINQRSFTNDVNNLIEEILNEPTIDYKIASKKKNLSRSSISESIQKDLNNLDKGINEILNEPSSNINIRDCYIVLNRIDEKQTEAHLKNFEKKNNKINLNTNKHEYITELNIPEEDELYSDQFSINLDEDGQEFNNNLFQNFYNYSLKSQITNEIQGLKIICVKNSQEKESRFEEFFQCDQCKNCYFRHLTQLKIHELRVHHNIEIDPGNNECPKCKIKCYESYISFIQHLLACYFPNLFRCKTCKYQFDSYSKFLFHIKYIHTNSIYSCSVCERKFKFLKEVIDHEKLMHCRENIFCEICLEKTNSKKSLFEHYKNKHLIKKENSNNYQFFKKINSSAIKFFDESECSTNDPEHSISENINQPKKSSQNEYEDVQISQENQLQNINHKIQKNDLIRGLIDRKHQCKWCMLRFYTKSQLKQHETTHTNSVLYCPICDKEFNHKDRLSGHMKCHMEPSLECKVCGKKFKRLCNLYNHELVHGLTEHAFMLCQFCGRGFRSRRDYQNHVIANHRDQLIKSDSKICDPKEDYD